MASASDGRITDKLTMVLPVALSPAGPVPIWRTEAATSIRHLQLVTCLELIARRFNRSDVLEILIIAPPRDLETLHRLLPLLSLGMACRLVDETEACPEMATERYRGRVSGWKLQQILKMAAAERVQTPFFLTLDTDAICIRRCRYEDLIQAGRAITNVQRPADYMSLYPPGMALVEALTKSARMATSRRVAGGMRPPGRWLHYYGETPTIFHTSTMQSALAEIARKRGRHWRVALLDARFWIEHGLYYAHAESSGALERHHTLRNRRTLLDLDRSIWLPRQRSYCAGHHVDWPRVDDEATPDGYFVVLQTWFGSAGWLPAPHRNLEDYYEHVWRRLGITEDVRRVLAA